MKATAALTLCLALAACSNRSGSAPATGPFHFESTERNITIDSTVNVRYGSQATVVDEDVQFGQVTAHVEYRVDPKTYSAVSYAIRNDPEEEEPSLTVSPAGASVTTKTGGHAVAKAPVPGAPSWVFGNYASSFVVLPWLVRATRPQSVNAFMPSVFHGKATALRLSVIPPTAARPAGIPAGDASISLGPSNARKRPSMVTVWYDPETSVADSVSIGGATAFVRKP